MNRSVSFFLAATVFLLYCGECRADSAQEANGSHGAPGGNSAESAKANIEQMSFLTGKWRAAEGDEITEEIWGSVEGDSIVGHCHSVQNSKSTLYELIAILKGGNALVMRIKHFKNGFVPWDEQAEPGDLSLIKVANNEATFQNRSKDTVTIHYKRTDDKLTADVTVLRDGKAKVFSSAYQLVK
ncbi:hypothetical protein KF728_17450 [Candidatus Obscuribacterales bacterium]|nr:hypothetical protein [Candidatus Obscuribacterales bacterium]